ncbi:hypothetical protein NIB75_13695 [Bacteroides uniformis]|nr:hypothetical protein [Bacteroides uniformis]
MTAANPQIVKYCAVHEYEKMFTLINNSSRYAGLLMLFVLLPLCFEAEFVLTLWLGEIPDDTVFFTRIILIQSLIQTMARPIVTGIHANGRMKWPNVLSGSVLLSIVPISWVLFKDGCKYVRCSDNWYYSMGGGDIHHWIHFGAIYRIFDW